MESDPNSGSSTKRQPEALWFQQALVHVRVSHTDGASRISVLEFHAPAHSGTPLHVHHTHDEIFHVLRGEVTWSIGEQQHTCGTGETLFAPRGVPHTYRVTSPDGAHWLAISDGPDFEGFVRAGSRRADGDGLPPAAAEPSPAAMRTLVEAARAHGIEILGAPGI